MIQICWSVVSVVLICCIDNVGVTFWGCFCLDNVTFVCEFMWFFQYVYMMGNSEVQPLSVVELPVPYVALFICTLCVPPLFYYYYYWGITGSKNVTEYFRNTTSVLTQQRKLPLVAYWSSWILLWNVNCEKIIIQNFCFQPINIHCSAFDWKSFSWFYTVGCKFLLNLLCQSLLCFFHLMSCENQQVFFLK